MKNQKNMIVRVSVIAAKSFVTRVLSSIVEIAFVSILADSPATLRRSKSQKIAPIMLKIQIGEREKTPRSPIVE